MTTDALMIERRGPVMVLHLDDGKANALTFDLISAIKAAVVSWSSTRFWKTASGRPAA